MIEGVTLFHLYPHHTKVVYAALCATVTYCLLCQFEISTRTARNRRQVPGPVGHIRWRAPIFEPNSEGSLDLFDGAMALADVN